MRQIFLILTPLLIMAGCSGGYPFRTDRQHEKYLVTAQQPVSTGYPISTQRTMQSMQHWDLLADKVASQGSKALEHFFAGADMGVYVAPAGTTPFAKAYLNRDYMNSPKLLLPLKTTFHIKLLLS